MWVRAATLLRRNALLALFVQLLADTVTLQVGQVIHEQFALEMIHLMLQAHRDHAIQIPLKGRAGPILGPHPDARRPLDIIEYVGDRQTALFGLRGTLAREDLGVDEYQRFGAVLGDIHDDQPAVNIHLAGRQSDARGLVHGLEQVVDKPAQRRVELLHRPCAGAQARIRILQNG